MADSDFASTLAGRPDDALAAELLAAYEELRAQNQELTATRAALEAERWRYQDLFDSAPDGYVVTDLHGIIVEANRAAGELLGRDHADLADKPLATYVKWPQLRELFDHLARFRAGEEVANWEMRVSPPGASTKDVAVKVRAAGTAIGQPAALRWSLRDITERKQAEAEQQRLMNQVAEERRLVEALAHSLVEERDVLQTVMENTTAALAYLDADLRIQRLNRACVEAWGAIDDRTPGYVPFRLHPEVENRVLFERVRDTGEALTYQAMPLSPPSEPDAEVRYWDWSLVPVTDADGQVRGLVLSMQDVTERIAERQRIEELAAAARRQAEQLEAYDYTVAHDLRNPLSMILGTARLLAEALNKRDEHLDRLLESIADGTLRMTEIVNSLLLLSSARRNEVKIGPVDMGQVVHQAWEQVAPLVELCGARISAPDRWPVATGYAPWLQSVWVNYLSNGLKYGGKPPVLDLGYCILATGAATAEQAPSWFDFEKVKADIQDPHAKILFWIRDHGPGLSEEEQRRLFVAFSQLDRPEKLGHGLGLAIVRRVVDRLGGDLGVESQPSAGSTFWFTLLEA